MKNNYVVTLLLAAILIPALTFAQCLPGWNYFQPVAINNSLAQTLTNYQVKLTVNTATPIAAGHMNANGDDIRFTTSACANVNYWIESGMNTASTVIWVKVPSLTASGNTTIDMYYGNVAATPVSNGDSVFLLFDDFNGPALNSSKWTVQGSPSILNQTAGILNFAGNNNWEYVRSNTTWNSAVVIESREYCENVSAAMVLGYAGTDNRFTFRENSSNLKGVTFDPDVSGGNAWHTTTYPAVQHSSAAYYEFSLDVDFVGNTIMVNRFCNTTTANCNTTSQSLNAATGTGFYVGFSSYASSYIEHVDWIKVRQFVSQVPVTTVGAEQSTTSIVTAALSVSSFCDGDLSTVNFTANGSYVSGNVFSAQLSGASGSFAAPTVIGTLASSATGPQTINVVIPVATPAGNAYRVRVVSSTPVIMGNDNGSNLTINLRPVLSVTSPFTGICFGFNDTLTASGALSYVWNSGPTTAQIIVSPASPTTYEVYGTDANGCMDTATFIVVVNPNPSILATAVDGTLCDGESDSLMVSGTNTYLWSTTETTSAIEVTPAATTTYTVTGTDANGCMDTTTVQIIVNALPVVTVSSAMDTLCTTDVPALLSGTPAGGTWSGSGVVGATLDPSLANIGSNTATYVYTDSLTGCSSSDSLSIYVDVCTGTVFTLQSSEFTVFPNPNNGTFAVNWNGINTASIEVYNALGQIQEVRIVKSGTLEMFTFETSGFYSVVAIAAEGTRTVQRVVVAE